MQEIYRNSILTLALSRAASPDESCLGTPGTSRGIIQPFQVETKGIIGDKNGGIVECTCAFVHYGYYDKALYGQSLGFRAWALQERFLSPRVLSIGLELFWDCDQVQHACETFPGGLEAFADDRSLQKNSLPKTSDKVVLGKAWQKIVDEFTLRKLTYPEVDKLVAISGIARHVGNAMDEELYLAGHFYHTLPESLNWSVRSYRSIDWCSPRHGTTPRRMIKPADHGLESGTPTWSWASMDGPIYWGNNSLDVILAEVEAYKLTLADEANPTGNVISASLTVQTYCAEIFWSDEDTPVMRKKSKTWNHES